MTTGNVGDCIMTKLFVQNIERANQDLELLNHLDKLYTTELRVYV